MYMENLYSIKGREIKRRYRGTVIASFLFSCLVFLPLSGCKGDKGEPPAQKPQETQIAEIAPVQQKPEGSVVAEPGKKEEEADKNTLPEVVSINLSPKLVYPGTKIKAEVEGRDEDGDAVSFTYEWKKNDRVIPNIVLDELDTTAFKKGDLITLYVAPFDGKEKGKMRWSTTVMIANRPPEITSFPPTGVANGKYIYEVKANDEDGDTLSYSLEYAPPGMTIDPSTGIIQWNIPSDAKDSYSFRIVVTDGDGKAFQGLTLNPKIEIR